MMALETTDSKGGAIEDSALSPDEILALLNDESDDDDNDDNNPNDPDGSIDDNDNDNTEKDDKDDKEDKKNKLESKDDEDDDEEEDKKLDDEEDELVTPVRRKEILAKYPNFFKDFPAVEKAYYRDQQWGELFGTLDDGREALEKAQALEGYEESLMKGDTESILQAVKDNDPDAWDNVVDDYLSTLGKVDNKAYLHVLSQVAKEIVVSAAQAGKSGKDQKLADAAVEIHKHIFGTDQFTPHQKLGKGEEDRSGKDALAEEKQQFLQERFETAREDLSTRVNNSLRGTVEGGIDLKVSMTPYVWMDAIRDVMCMLDQIIRADTEFMKVFDSLWKKSADVKFNDASVKRIRAVYMSKAKTLLPAVIKRSRREALRGSGKGSSDTGTSRRSPDSSRRPTGRRKPSSERSNDGKGMSTLDFLNQD